MWTLRLGAAGKCRILRLDFARFFAYSPMKELRFSEKKNHGCVELAKLYHFTYFFFNEVFFLTPCLRKKPCILATSPSSTIFLIMTQNMRSGCAPSTPNMGYTPIKFAHDLHHRHVQACATREDVKLIPCIRNYDRLPLFGNASKNRRPPSSSWPQSASLSAHLGPHNATCTHAVCSSARIHVHMDVEAGSIDFYGHWISS